MQGAPCIPDSHPYRITSTKCRINTVVSPDDWHIVAGNMQRLTNIQTNKHTKKYCAPSWLYSHDYFMSICGQSKEEGDGCLPQFCFLVSF
jgi:hypothetical protein